MPWVSRFLLACLMGLALAGNAAPSRAETAPTFEFVFRADLEMLAARTDGEVDLDTAMLSAADIVRARLGDLDGYTITNLGDGRLAIAITHADAPKIVRDVFGVTGELDFKLVDISSDPDQTRKGIAQPGRAIFPWANGDPPIAVMQLGGISGDYLIDAQAGVDPMTGHAVVNLRFDHEGQTKFAKLTSANVGAQIAIILDGKVLSAPTIHEPILGGAVQLSGNFTQESAEQLAIALRSGALPVPFRLIEERVISATP